MRAVWRSSAVHGVYHTTPHSKCCLGTEDTTCAGPDEISKSLGQLAGIYYWAHGRVGYRTTRSVQGVEYPQLAGDGVRLAAIAGGEAGRGKGLLGSADDDQLGQADGGVKAELVRKGQISVCPI
jgi:hypothetical protein